jgi:hypothetical protein
LLGGVADGHDAHSVWTIVHEFERTQEDEELILVWGLVSRREQ